MSPPLTRSFPSQSVPEGWYQVGWSGEYPTGRVAPLTYFGKDLVAYRDTSGRMVVLDAYCRHMGAHLGEGGVVDGTGVRCPFHGWKFDSDGCNVDIPYSSPDKMGNLRLKSWDVRELHGLVLVWHSPLGREPQWEPARWLHDDDAYWAPYPDAAAEWLERPIAAQVVIENAVDAAHFAFVHTAAHVPDIDDFDVDRHTFKLRLDYPFGVGHDQTWATPHGPVQGSLVTQCQGLGFIWSRLHGFDHIHHCVAVTPITATLADLRATTFVPRRRGDNSEMSEAVRDLWIRQQYMQVNADVRVWSNLSFTQRPPFAKSEAKAMRAFKSWARQFYVAVDEGALP
jgi:3-ketosteroid 9alpha-monooxygenase subunit A